MSLFALPGIFMTIPAGLISDRFGMKLTGSISFCLMIAGTVIFAMSSKFLFLSLGRAVSGLGALTLSIIAAQLLTKWFIRFELGLAMGIYSTAFPLGTIISFNLFGNLGKTFGWQIPILITTIFSLAVMIVFFLLYKVPPVPEKAATAAYEGGWRPSGNIFLISWPVWFVGLSWLLDNAAFISLLTFGPDFLLSLGFDVTTASLIASSFMWGALIVSPLIGITLDKFFSKVFLIAFGNLALAVIFVIIPFSGASLIPIMIILGFAAALVPVPTYALPADLISEENLGVAFGIITTCLNIGIVIGPFSVGVLRDYSGSYTTGFILMATFSILSAASIYILRLTKKA